MSETILCYTNSHTLCNKVPSILRRNHKRNIEKGHKHFLQKPLKLHNFLNFSFRKLEQDQSMKHDDRACVLWSVLTAPVLVKLLVQLCLTKMA